MHTDREQVRRFSTPTFGSATNRFRRGAIRQLPYKKDICKLCTRVSAKITLTECREVQTSGGRWGDAEWKRRGTSNCVLAAEVAFAACTRGHTGALPTTDRVQDFLWSGLHCKALPTREEVHGVTSAFGSTPVLVSRSDSWKAPSRAASEDSCTTVAPDRSAPVTRRWCTSAKWPTWETPKPCSKPSTCGSTHTQRSSSWPRRIKGRDTAPSSRSPPARIRRC